MRLQRLQKPPDGGHVQNSAPTQGSCEQKRINEFPPPLSSQTREKKGVDPSSAAEPPSPLARWTWSPMAAVCAQLAILYILVRSQIRRRGFSCSRIGCPRSPTAAVYAQLTILYILVWYRIQAHRARASGAPLESNGCRAQSTAFRCTVAGLIRRSAAGVSSGPPVNYSFRVQDSGDHRCPGPRGRRGRRVAPTNLHLTEYDLLDHV